MPSLHCNISKASDFKAAGKPRQLFSSHGICPKLTGIYPSFSSSSAILCNIPENQREI